MSCQFPDQDANGSDDLRIVVRYEAAFHFDIAIWAGVCFFHVDFLLLLFAGRCVGACFNR